MRSARSAIVVASLAVAVSYTGVEHLTARQWRRLGRMLDEHDPTDEIGAAWAVKERLRMLLAESEPAKKK